MPLPENKEEVARLFIRMVALASRIWRDSNSWGPGADETVLERYTDEMIQLMEDINRVDI